MKGKKTENANNRQDKMFCACPDRAWSIALVSLSVVISACQANGSSSDTAESAAYEVEAETVSHDGLMWQRGYSQEYMTLLEGQEYCSDLVVGGHDDWRLPTIDELRTIIEGCTDTEHGGDCAVTEEHATSNNWSDACYCEDNGGPGTNGFYWEPDTWEYTIDPSNENDANGYFWASTTVPDESNSAWCVIFSNGNVTYFDQDLYNYVRCVRDS